MIARIYAELIKKGLRSLEDIKDEEIRAKVQGILSGKTA